MTTSNPHPGRRSRDLVIDGHILGVQEFGGVSRMLQALLPELEAQRPAGTTTRVVKSEPPRSVPGRSLVRRISRRIMAHEPFAGLGWHAAQAQRSRSQLALAAGPASAWLSTYYFAPRAWPGPVVALAYDLYHFRFPAAVNSPRRRRIVDGMRACLREATVVVAISEATRDDLITLLGIPGERVTVAHLGVDPATFSLSASTTGAGLPIPYLLFVGRRGEQKGFPVLLAGFARYLARNPDSPLALLVVGAPWGPSEAQEISSFGIERRVLHMTSLPDLDLAEVYRHACGLAYPSQYEGFGLPLIEALACGSQILASRIPSSTEVASGVAHFFDPGDIESVAIGIEKLVAEPPRARAEIRAKVVERFSWNACASRVWASIDLAFQLARPGATTPA